MRFDDLANHPRPLLPFLELVLAWNAGVSYSLFRASDEYGRWILVGVAAAALVALGVWLWRTSSPLTALAVGLIAGGAAGNMIDRIVYGAVADFLFFHTATPLGPLSNYVFNGADVAITAGVGLLLYESLVPARPASAPPPSP